MTLAAKESDEIGEALLGGAIGRWRLYLGLEPSGCMQSPCSCKEGATRYGGLELRGGGAGVWPLL
jgi:hypothetical protein